MKIATILFTYNRPEHTKIVLNALKNNDKLPEKLFIFHDGMKEDTDVNKWNQVETIIHGVKWCNTEIISNKHNKGLSDSVVDGVNYVFNYFDAVIVLEDDCVTHHLFMDYMNAALKKYKDTKQVFSIGASAEDVVVPPNGCDAYFGGRIESWGWGTWKDRWQFFKRDYRIVAKIKKDEGLNEWCQVWGRDLEATLIGNVQGKTDSWAAFWALSVIKERGLCLEAYRSLVKNIGLDGTGVHCGVGKYDRELLPDSVDSFVLPDVIEVVPNYKEVFVDYYPWVDPVIREKYYRDFLSKWMEITLQHGSIEEWLCENKISKIGIWGTGKICDLLIDSFSDAITVTSIIESHPVSEEYREIPVVMPEAISNEIDAVLVIPGYDLKHITPKVLQRHSGKIIPIDRVVGKPLMRDLEPEEVEFLGNDYGGFMVCTRYIPKNAIVYSFGIGEDLSFIEDLNLKYGSDIYAFDPTPISMKYVVNHHLFKNKKIHFENIGLSDVDELVRFFLPSNDEYVFLHRGLKSDGIDVSMRRLDSIAQRLGHHRINLLKMDIEGSEFKVVESLVDMNVQIDQICVEVHDRFINNGRNLLRKMNKTLHEMGFLLVAISDSEEELTYLNSALL